MTLQTHSLNCSHIYSFSLSSLSASLPHTQTHARTYTHTHTHTHTHTTHHTEAGNATGAESLLSIADRMQMIMDRSEAKMSKKLELMPEAAAAPDPANPFGQDEAVAKKWWPFQHESLLAKGGSV